MNEDPSPYADTPSPHTPVGAHVPAVTWRTLLRDMNAALTRMCSPPMVPSEHHEHQRRVARDLARINAGLWEKHHQERAQARERVVTLLLRGSAQNVATSGRFMRAPTFS